MMKVGALDCGFGCRGDRSSTVFAQRPDREIDQPLTRSLNWFAYVGGNDIREACGPGGRSRMRLVYNALWDEQVRIYDVFLQPDGTAGLATRVLANQGTVTNVIIGSLNDVTAPWRYAKSRPHP